MVFDAVGDTILKHKILLDLHIDDQDETHRMLKDGDVAGCITTRDKAFQSCTCTYLGTMTYRMYCSAEHYKTFFPNGVNIEALKNVPPVIIYNEKDLLHLKVLKKRSDAHLWTTLRLISPLCRSIPRSRTAWFRHR